MPSLKLSFLGSPQIELDGDDLEQAAILADLANLAMESRAYDEAADLWRAARDTFARVEDIASKGRWVGACVDANAFGGVGGV